MKQHDRKLLIDKQVEKQKAASNQAFTMAAASYY